MKPVVMFAAWAVPVLAGFAGVGLVFSRYETWQAESFGDRRLERPLTAECEIAHALLSDRADPERADLLRRLRAADDRKLVLRAFAWRSNGPRAGRGADWRKCPGLGRFVRGLGMARLASGEEGPAIYLSRATLSGDRARVFETVYGAWAGYAADPDRPGLRTWTVTLTRSAGGAWRIAGRAASETP